MRSVPSRASTGRSSTPTNPEFRDYLALYDPWGQRKMNISNGHLSAFLDWFVRDRSGRRFYVEPSFTEAIHDLGLLRYDDES